MKHTRIFKILLALFAVVLCFGPVGLAEPLGTAFTYQGRLIDANEAADGLYDFQFKLFNDETVGNQLWGDVNTPEVDVIDGYFTVELDFGGVFDGNERWLDIGVRPGDLDDPNAYTSLTPRQEITPTPYALYALNGGGGGSLWQVNGTSIYYNNGNVGIGTTSPAAKLDVSGDISAASDYKIGGITVLSVAGTANTLVGLDAGAVNTGSGNTFSGYQAGYSNTTGSWNTFSGTGAGGSNTTGSWNTFSGTGAGQSNTEGYVNTFLGEWAGLNNTTGNSNTFSGNNAGYSNTTGSRNTFTGYQAGHNNTIGSGNVFLGFEAGYNETGSNKLYIANSSGIPLIYGDFSAGNVGLGTTSPAAKLDVAGQVKITDGSQGNGKVLTSDSSGLATWQNLTETDPTVLASVKDGVAWGEVSGIPAGFADGVDDVGAGDNLGNHNAAQNLKLNGYWLSGDGGNEGVYVTNDGSVGIGMSSPFAKLTVSNPSAPDGPTIQMSTGGSGSTNTFLEIFKNDYDAGYTINQARKGLAITDNSTTWTISTNRNAGEWGGKLRFGTLTTVENYTSGFDDWMVIQAGGNVGIGETNPSNKLVVGQGGDIVLKAKAADEDAGDIIFATSTGTQKGRMWGDPTVGQNRLYLSSGDNTADITIDPSGNVGIGTTIPAAKLEVNGNIKTAGIYETFMSNYWIPVESSRSWQSVAMSADGTKQTAVVFGGQIYISTNSGNNWIAKESNRNWVSVAMSADGTKQTAAVYNGQIYVSTDSGNTWTAKGSNRIWVSVAMSADGTKQTAVVFGGQIYVSTDSGNTWTAKESNRQWRSVAMSADGTRQTAVVSGGQIYISTDSGNTWTAKESDRSWWSVAMSADGTKKTAVDKDGQIYVSMDSGNTWTAKESNRSWESVAMSADGTKQTAVVYGGQIYVSTDSGNTWTAKESNRYWILIAMSADGTKQTAVDAGGQIYIISCIGVGIGTTNPGANLEVAGQVKITGGSPADGKILTSDSTGLATWQTPVADWVISGNNIYSGVSGNVGIGTTSPSAKLEIAGGTIKATNSASTGKAVYGVASNTGDFTNYGGLFEAAGKFGYGVFGFATGSDGYGVYGNATGSDGYGVYGNATGSDGYGVYGNATGQYADAIRGEATGDNGTGVFGWAKDVSGSNYGGYFVAAGGNYSSGVKGFASNSGFYTNYGGYFIANGTGGSRGVQSSGLQYDFYAAGPGDDYGSASSIRWMKDIREIDEPLEKVMKLRGVYFNWDAEHGGKHDVGMVAEEVGKALSEIVTYESDGQYTTGIDYSKMTPLLVEAVKALKTENDELKKRLEVLEEYVVKISEGGKK